ncbi:hypothetical protein SNE40_016661 [Patella caerulea]|uniref:EGF-like domain-containing protein n=1 Tax=Patella caerulea TaxID=87958 RepID=A0AAN8JDN7_PATCE
MDGVHNHTGRQKPQPRSQRRSRLRNRGSQTCSSSDEEFYSDDNLRPYEEVKIAHHDKKLTGLGLTPDEHAVSPIGRNNSGHARAYSYMSGSDEEIDSPKPSAVPLLGRNGAFQPVIRSPDPIYGDQRIKIAQTSESEEDNRHPVRRCSRTGSIPPPTLPPPPPPPPIEDIPQRSPGPLRHKQFGPSVRGNYSDAESLRRQHLMETEGDFEPPYLVQADVQPRFPRTVPRSGSVPATRISELESNPYHDCSGFSDTYPCHYPNGDQPVVFQNNIERQSAYPQFGLPTIPMGAYPPPTDYNYYSKFSSASNRMKKHLKQRCTWRCTALILLMTCVALLACTVYFAVKSMYEEKVAKEQQLEKCQRGLNGAFNSSNKKPHQGADSMSNFPILTTLPPSIPKPVKLGQTLQHEIPAKSFWTTRLARDKDGFIKLNFSLSESAILGVYGRRSVSPSHAQFDFFKVVEGQRIQSRQKRSLYDKNHSNGRETGMVEFLKAGTWYLALFNDNTKKETVSFMVDVTEVQTGCEGNCHGHGECINGQCQCFNGYTKDDCSQQTCPEICKGNGIYVRGECSCHPGWKGQECELKENQCEVPNCNGNGHCINGQCVCFQGFQGLDCGIVDCVLPNCSGNGVCMHGECICFKGFKGRECSIPDKINITQVCAKDCSGHGVFDVEAGTCVCERHFTGDDCQTEVCRLECYHGYCKNQRCVCNEGWSGALCDQIQCDHRCNAHGFCNNGTCVCRKGWNGRHCTMDGCPSACSNHGECQHFQDGWQCNCQDGWKGKACNIAMEAKCSDTLDNDNDGLLDCLDPDCCKSAACKTSKFCKSSPEPEEILLSKQSTSTTASFFDKMRFLIEENSVQTYAMKNSFNETQVSVIRGRVTTKDGTPLISVRVGVVTQPLYGYTLSREKGVFDILVNGGGSVKLEFIRQPFGTKTASVLVPWNQIITMGTVVMTLRDEPESIADPALCSVEHEHYLLRPIVLSTWQHTQLGACPERSTIIPESQVLQESLDISGTDVHLVYHSSESPGYMSLIMIQMTPAKIPPKLSLVHLKVSVDGVVTEKVFEADPNLKYTYSWNRKNVFNQKVYGIVTARVNVGYRYENCEYIFWETRSTTLNGFDLTSSEIGGWNLDIHHTYNFQEGILHKGDGTNIYLKEKPKKIINILGSGNRRQLDCTGCNGKALDNRLLAPVALASGLDGSLYVGDYNFIRKLSPEREEIASILEMSTKSVPYKFYMTVSPVDGKLYISDYMFHKVIRVKTMGPVRDLRENLEDVAGNGEECTPGEVDLCGDGTTATLARLRYPKGIAINKDGVIYIADGPNIRRITTDGIINTLIGTQEQLRQWTPMPCDDILPAESVSLKWPTALAIDPLDDTLHILDQGIVLKLTKDYKLVTVAGRPVYCPPRQISFLPAGVLNDDEQASNIADHVTLVSPATITFGPHGDLYIVESDTHHINRVRVVTTDGHIHHFAGTKSKCDCRKISCKCYDAKERLAAQALFSTPTSVTVTPDGIMHIADMGNFRIFSIVSELPSQNIRREYEVVSPETQEIYIFNRYGQHKHTINIMTNQYMYNYTYNVNSFYGKLTRVTDTSGNSIQIKRRYDTRVEELITPSGDKCDLLLDNLGRLYSFTAPDNTTATFTYMASTGLLESKHTSYGKVFMYKYDNMGRLLRISQPTGEITQLKTDVNTTGSIVHVTTDSSDVVAMATYGSVQSVMHGSTQTKVTYLPDGAVIVLFPSNLTVALETGGHPIMENEHRMHFKRKVIIPDAYMHRMEWRFYLRRKGRTRQSRIIDKIGQRMRINGENLLTVEYDRNAHMETIMDKDLREILTIVYEKTGLPTHFIPATGHNAMNITYSSRGDITRWQYGEMLEDRKYNEKGLLIERMATNGAQFRYFYRYGAKKPTDVILPSGKQYLFHHDVQGNLHSVTTPVLGKHQFHTVLSVGIQRMLYIPPGIVLPFIMDYDTNGKLLRVLHPGDTKRVHYRYNNHFQVSKVIFDETDVSFTYNSKVQRMASAKLLSRGYSCVLQYDYISSLVKSYTLHFPQDPTLQGINITLVYDNNFRLAESVARLTNNISMTNMLSYSSITGKLNSIKDIVIDWPSQERQVLTNADFKTTREYDNYGRLQEIKMEFAGNIRYMLHINYDHMNLVHQWRRRIGQTDSMAMEYIYDIDSNMVDVLVEGKSAWKYGYDANGNINKITDVGITKEMEFDVGDRITRFGELRYKFDEDGFMAQRGFEHLSFNSLGQLTTISHTRQHKFSYFYDPQGRLAVQRDQFGKVMQYFYANVLSPQQITHTYNHTSGEMTQYFFDTQGHLVAMERKSNTYYIASDPNGSPLVVFDSRGFVVKQCGYNPLGLQESDSNPNFELSFGFQSLLYNPVTQIAMKNKRPYDTLTGHWLSPDYQHVFKKLDTVISEPEILNAYQNRHLLNTHLKSHQYPRLDLHDWLNVLGYDVYSLAPEVDYTGDLHPNKCDRDLQLLPSSSAFECTFKRDMNNLLTLTTVPRSKITPLQNLAKETPSPFTSIFGDGVTVSIINGRVHINIADIATELSRKIATVLLNGSEVVNLQFTIRGKDVHYFVKPSYAEADDDLRTLGIHSNLVTFENGINVSVQRGHGHRTGRSRDEVDVRIHGNHSVINIRYGTNIDQEHKRILLHAKDRAVRQLWSSEKYLLKNSLPSHYQWTEQEIRELVSGGQVPAYEGQYIRDTDNYPELADDCNNIQLVKSGR